MSAPSADRIFVKPTENTKVCSKCKQRVGEPFEWYVLGSDGSTKLSGPHETRGEAKLDALDRRDGEAIVLLRSDGTVHSEMRPAQVSIGGQVVNGGGVSE